MRWGKCVRCGYDKCLKALEFHHLNPSKKDFTISNDHFKLLDAVNESKKCILICSNCHKELHDNLWTIEELNLNAPRLCRMRKTIIEQLAEQLTDMVAEGTKIETALEILAVAYLTPDVRGMCLPYFSTTRWYLADGAEKLLERYN